LARGGVNARHSPQPVYRDCQGYQNIPAAPVSSRGFCQIKRLPICNSVSASCFRAQRAINANRTTYFERVEPGDLFI
jgi:hypothetical protein